MLLVVPTRALLTLCFAGSNVPSSVVEVRAAGAGKGDGCFAVQEIAAGTALGQYVGEHIKEEEMVRRYGGHTAGVPEPDYCFHLAGELESGEAVDMGYIDAENSQHWTRYMNHNEAANVDFELKLEERPPAVLFTACKDIREGDELCFDYGVGFWDGRSSQPVEGTDSRSYSSLGLLSSAADPSSAPLGTPMSEEAVFDVLRASRRDFSEADKRAALGRALDYFGVDTLGAVPVVAGAASARWWWWRKRAFAAAAGPSPTRRPWREPPQREDARLEDTTLPQLALALLREIDDGRGFGDGGGGGGGDDEWYDAAAQAEDAELIRRLKEGSL